MSRSNVLFIAIDDLRPAFGCYGDVLAKTPNIDAFATTARQFNFAYVQQAVCGPSRTSMLTGRLPDRTRVWHNRNRFRETHPDLVTLPQLFKQAGYQSIALGKIFSGNKKELDPISWSEPETLNLPSWKKYLLPENQGKGSKHAAWEAPDVDDSAYPDGKIAELAQGRLREFKNSGESFFLAVGFFKPHLPFNAPKKYWELHREADFVLTESQLKKIAASPEIALHTHRELGGYKGVAADEVLDRQQIAKLRHGYYACVSYIDAQVGRVLQTLKELGLDDNTIVVLWGDHGFSLGEQTRWCKGTNFELDTHVPLIIRTPGIPQPGIPTNALVESVDIYPTLAELAGVDAPADLDGQSMTKLLRRPTASGRDYVFSQFNRPWKATTPEVMGYSIRSRNQRYTRWVEWQSRNTFAEEFYDYSAAPVVAGPYALEDANRFGDPTYEAAQTRMSQQLDNMLKERLSY
ncbi:MAG: sulfatase [Planctomycetota bacterium]